MPHCLYRIQCLFAEESLQSTLDTADFTACIVFVCSGHRQHLESSLHNTQNLREVQVEA